ncbi:MULTISPECIES: hypothetical protein [Marinobacter]|uniref:hypothetical protein n=1 Tax=Marinobacter TaxID=2742 RepID=UPI001C95159F|nr:hypothetical protein [Marinobacter nauticus]MBY5937175.1 hypothetical protein [Marinobacter nauticus]MBY5954582.1 hypothetical protein [Marinobacter nauticus]MBY6008196.1 hypothetical protein [Marinobacter nauticus]MBY6194030.1 hypothetical protein [Marinobacter nauticus]MBY6215177.1 hypothetical protein [Marinobacter nauticus]
MNHRNTQPRLNALQAGLLLLSLALAPLAHSENLTEDDVTSFIASMEAMQPLIDKHQDFIESIEDPADDEREVDFARMMSSMVDEVKGHEMYDDLDDLVDDFGFSSPEAWARKGDRIVSAWFAIEMEAQPDMAPDIAEMERAIAEMENNPDMPEAAKAQMREMMEQMMVTVKSASSAAKQVSDADKRAVRPHVERLKAVMEQDESDYE